MIAIIGTTHEDVLYFETILKNRVTEVPVYERFPVIQGTIFNQEVVICYGATTSYLVAPLTERIISTYKPMIIIQVGKCKSLTDDWKNGDIAISDEHIALDVDQCEYKNVKLGQIPGLNFSYHIYHDVHNIINKTFDKFMSGNVYNGTFLSSDRIPQNVEDLRQYFHDGYIFGHQNRCVVDCESFSSMIVCQLNQTPFIAIKAVDSKVGEITKVNNYIKTLDTYAIIGKAVISFIGELGRRDLKEE